MVFKQAAALLLVLIAQSSLSYARVPGSGGLTGVIQPGHTHHEEEENDQELNKSWMREAAAFDRWSERKDAALEKGEVFADPEPDTKFCYKKKYRKRTLKLIRESPFIGLFNDLLNLTRFEGSSITYAKGAYWVVFDSLRTIAKLGVQFQFRGPENSLIPEDSGEVESQYEGLQYMPSTDTFLAVKESHEHDVHGLVPLTEEIILSADHSSWKLGQVCPAKFKLESANKGWEGLHYYEKDGERYLMGLCESNFCKANDDEHQSGLQRGNGRLILTRFVENKQANRDEDPCHWEVVKEIKLPESADFLDYAGIAFTPHPFGSRVAVVSQEDAAVWVGEFDWDRLEFKHDTGVIYHFPRSESCRRLYCNSEGLTWLDHQRLLFATDAAKSTQGFECMTHDQGVQIMALP